MTGCSLTFLQDTCTPIVEDRNLKRALRVDWRRETAIHTIQKIAVI